MRGPRIQEFVQRVHREGLPVARLFETKSALVHLGLSPRGKPGPMAGAKDALMSRADESHARDSRAAPGIRCQPL